MANTTAAEYENDYRARQTANADNSYETRKANTAQKKTARTASTQTYITGQNEIIDSTTDNAVQKVQQQIDAAPGEYQEEFDRNAIAEMVNRKKLEESMANMGLTDSGLNRTQQTALSVQRMNADADARKSMREYVNELENYITDLTVEGENQKKQIALDANYKDQQDFQSWDAANDTWYSNTLDEINTDAITYGANMWQADEANRATVEAANIAAAAEKEAARIEAAKEANDLLIDLMDKGNMTYDEAATVVFGTEQTEQQSSTQRASSALTGITNWNAAKGGPSSYSFWHGPDGDGKDVYDDVIYRQLKQSEAYKALNDVEQAQAVALAIAQSVSTTWDGRDNDEGDTLWESKNGKRILSALGYAGYEGEDLENLKEIAGKAYKALR